MRHTRSTRRTTSAVVTAFILLLASFGLGLAAASPASAATLVAEEGSAEPTPDPTAAEPEPSESPEPPSTDETPPTITDPTPPPVDEADPTDDLDVNESAGPGTGEPGPTDTAESSTPSIADSSELGPEQIAARSSTVEVADSLLAPLVAGDVLVFTFVSAAEIFLGESFFDTAYVRNLDQTIPILGGSVTFRLYGPGDDTCADEPVFTSGPIFVDPNGSGEFWSESFTPDQPGTYRFTATWRLDRPGMDLEGFSPCNAPDESVLVLAPPDPDDDDDDGDGDDEDSEDDDDGNGKKSHRDADDNAALPNTGASDHLNLIGGTGIALTLAGLTIVAATRRRGGAHLA